MKKILAILLSMLLMLTMLISCASNQTTPGGNHEEEEKVEKVEIKSFDELLKKTTEAQKNLKSYGANMDFIMDIEAMGEKLDMTMDIEVEADIENMLTHVLAKADIMGDEVTFETYGDMGENAATYMSQNGEWLKQTFDEEYMSQFNELLEKAQNLELDYSKYISDATVEEVEYDGKDCYKATCSMSIKLFELLEEMELSEYIDVVFEAAGLTSAEASIFKTLFADLGTVSVVQYVDAYNMNPVALEIDMTDAMKLLANKVIEIASVYAGEEADISELASLIKINKVYVSMVTNNVNDVIIEIPDEALQAEEMSGIIGGADGPTSIITDDGNYTVGYGEDGTAYYFDSEGNVVYEEAA